ncbi:MAG: RNA-binding cell elongation regulator Jag/EloR [Eubacterium ventriosum]
MVLGIGSKPAIIKAKKNQSVEDIAREFLNKVFTAMELTVKIDIKIVENEKENIVNINIIGEDMGILIGKRGQTLDSLQYLVSLVINKECEKFNRVKLDTENYRERRKATLENLARNISLKVKRIKKPVALEPMKPYERRIIHSALQNDKFCTTKSEGDEPYRHVVVMLKKDAR